MKTILLLDILLLIDESIQEYKEYRQNYGSENH